jgi:hypothetical protein
MCGLHLAFLAPTFVVVRVRLGIDELFLRDPSTSSMRRTEELDR